jgi:hypothetical protein
MDLMMIPQALMVFYGGLVLGCGAVLGFIAGRNARRPLSQPEPPDLLRRVEILEDELEASQVELDRLLSDQEFMRRLKAPQPVADPRELEQRSVA